SIMFIVMNILMVQPKKSDHCILNYWAEVNIMIKTDLVNAVADKSELSKKDAAKAVDAVFESVVDSLKSGEKVHVIGCGNFEVRERSARKGRNPQTGEEIQIPASKVPAFKAGKALRDAVKKLIYIEG